MSEKGPTEPNNVFSLDERRTQRELDGEGARAAQRMLEHDENPYHDLGGGDPRAERLAEKRNALRDGLKEAEKVPLSEQGRVGPLVLTLKDIWALASSPSPNLRAYVKQELQATSRIKHPSNVVTQKDIAGTAGRGINQLINGFDRAKKGSLSGKRDEWSLTDYINDNPSRIWKNAETKEGLLQAIDSAYEIIRVFTGRETSIVVAGDEDGRREAAAEDLKAAKRWLEDLKAMFMEEAGVMKDSRRSSSNSARSRYNRVVRGAIHKASKDN